MNFKTYNVHMSIKMRLHIMKNMTDLEGNTIYLIKSILLEVKP